MQTSAWPPPFPVPPTAAPPRDPLPGTALAAALLAVAGAVGGFSTGMPFVGLGGLRSLGAASLLLPVAVTAVQVWGAVRLVRRRGAGVLVVSAVPALLWLLLVVGEAVQEVAHAGPLVLVDAAVSSLPGASVVAAGLALTRSTRAWLAGTRRGT